MGTDIYICSMTYTDYLEFKRQIEWTYYIHLMPKPFGTAFLDYKLFKIVLRKLNASLPFYLFDKKTKKRFLFEFSFKYGHCFSVFSGCYQHARRDAFNSYFKKCIKFYPYNYDANFLTKISFKYVH